jgi:LysR family nitrogen assimilation transcriptional regulator
MNVRHLRYFVEIAASGSLKRASEGLYVTQSALSRAVADLEAELGCALLERSQRGVTPTRQGAALARRARRILLDVDSLRTELLDEEDEPTGHVRLALPIGVRNRLTRPLVARLRKEHPGIRVDIADGTAHDNRTALLEHLADIAVIHEFERGLPLESRRLYHDPLCLVGPRSAGFSLRRPLEVRALADYPLILIHAPNQIRWTVDAALRRLRRRAQPVMEVSASPLILDLVEDGHGYAVLTESLISAALAQRRVSAGRLGSLRVTWVAAWPKGRPLTRSARIALDTLLALA